MTGIAVLFKAGRACELSSSYGCKSGRKMSTVKIG